MRLSLGKVPVRSSGRKPLTVTEYGGSGQDRAICSVAFPYHCSPSGYHPWVTLTVLVFIALRVLKKKRWKLKFSRAGDIEDAWHIFHPLSFDMCGRPVTPKLIKIIEIPSRSGKLQKLFIIVSSGGAGTVLPLRHEKVQKCQIAITLLKKIRELIFLMLRYFEFAHDRLNFSNLHDPQWCHEVHIGGRGPSSPRVTGLWTLCLLVDPPIC